MSGEGHVTDYFRPWTKQIIDDSLFSVTNYCWVYFGVRMFCISVVIVMLSSDLAWMYTLIKKVIMNHNMWSIFRTNVSLRPQSYFRLFLCLAYLKVMRAMNIWTRYIGGYIQECTVLCVKALDSCMYSRYLAGIFFFKWHLRLSTKTAQWAHTGGKLGVFWGLYYFDHIFVRVISSTALNRTAKYRVDSSTVLPSVPYFLLNVDIDILIFW